MEVLFVAEVVLGVNLNPKTKKAFHEFTQFNLSVEGHVHESAYLEETGLVNKEGSKALSTTLVQGLVANIHMAHEKGFRDSAEHLRWIIAELERGFIAVVDIKEIERKNGK